MISKSSAHQGLNLWNLSPFLDGEEHRSAIKQSSRQRNGSLYNPYNFIFTGSVLDSINQGKKDSCFSLYISILPVWHFKFLTKYNLTNLCLVVWVSDSRELPPGWSISINRCTLYRKTWWELFSDSIHYVIFCRLLIDILLQVHSKFKLVPAHITRDISLQWFLNNY